MSAAAVLALVLPVSAAPGHLDTTFAINGKRIVNASPGGDEAHDVVVQPDGKIDVLVNVDQSGANQRFGVYRFLPNGKRDTSFNGTGKILFTFGASSTLWASAIALTPGGRIVVGGTTSAQGGGYAFARLTKSGHLDPTFGTGGMAVIPPSTGGVLDLTVQTDGKIVFVGRSNFPCCGVVGRLTTAGKLDPGFGNSGTQDVTGLKTNGFLTSVVIRPSGKIVATGTGWDVTLRSYDVGVVQLTSGGGFDPTFNGGFGEAHFDFGAEEGGAAVALQHGEIVVAGSRNANSVRKVLLARIDTDGSLDTAFGTGGHVLANVGGGDAEDLAVAGNGKLLVVGPWRTSPTAGGFFLMRRNRNGGADTAFGHAGIVKPAHTYDGQPALAIQRDGKIVVVEATNGTGAPANAFVARYLAA
jgi:uncharacterized delta-60 repeat protein